MYIFPLSEWCFRSGKKKTGELRFCSKEMTLDMQAMASLTNHSLFFPTAPFTTDEPRKFKPDRVPRTQEAGPF